LDTTFIEPLVKATTNVVETMAMLSAQAGQAYRKEREEASGDVSAIVGVAGGAITGSLAVSFSEDCIKGVLSRMLGEDVQELGPELLDAVGELTNMISGAARAEISNHSGIELEAGIPAVVSGPAHHISHGSDSEVTVIPFTTEVGEFRLEACFKKAGLRLAASGGVRQ